MLKLNATTIYCDMDGVIADFDGQKDAVKRYAIEKGFFKKLKPIQHNLDAVKKIIEMGFNVKILTASPNEQADNDKIAWLKKHFGQIDYIICRVGQVKADFVKDLDRAVLLDDYIVNIDEWRKRGGQALQVGKDIQSIGELI